MSMERLTEIASRIELISRELSLLSPDEYKDRKSLTITEIYIDAVRALRTAHRHLKNAGDLSYQVRATNGNLITGAKADSL